MGDQVKKTKNRSIVNGIFIHIPKAGGTSVRRSLSKVNIHRWTKHDTALQVKKECKDSEWNNWIKVAWIRNPWERAYSLWKYCLEISKNHSNKDFKDWLLNSREVGNHIIDPLNRNPISALSYLTDSEGGMLVDFIGTVENIDADMKKMSQFLEFEINKLTVHHLNDRSMGKHYRKAYDEETRRYIEKVCWWEIETFGYHF